MLSQLNTLQAKTGPTVDDTQVMFNDVGGVYYMLGFSIKGANSINKLRMTHSTREEISRNLTNVVVLRASESGF